MKDLLWLCLFASAVSAQEVTAIKAARVLTVSGEPLEQGTVLIENGRITAVGAEVTIPDGATVIDGGAGVLTPGFIAANTSLGINGPSDEESQEITPFLHISQAIWPQAPAFQRARQMGLTTVGVLPGLRGVIGGVGAVLKTRGDTAEEMLVREGMGLLTSLGWLPAWGNIPIRSGRPESFFWRRPTTAIGVIGEIRQVFTDTKRFMESPDDPRWGPEERQRYTVLVQVLRGELPWWVAARGENDIRMAFRLADELAIPQWVLVEGTEGYRLAGDIAARHVPVIVGPQYFYPTTPAQGSEDQEVCWDNAGLLADAGVSVALTADTATEAGAPLTQAAFAVRHGLSPEIALRAITLTPAEILGVADRVGSLEAGKDADLVLLSGDPLAVTTRVLKVWIGGKLVFSAP